MSSIDDFPIGLEMDVDYPDFRVSLTLLSETQLAFDIQEGPYAHAETVDIHVVALGNGLFSVSWQESDGATVTNVQDYDRGLVHSHVTLPDGRFLRMSGTMTISRTPNPEQDERLAGLKALALEAMTSLFQRHDVSAVERLFSTDYIQRNPHIPQGREALKGLVASLPSTFYYEPGMILAEGEFVAVHSRIRGWMGNPQIVVDWFRIADGRIVEHWDVLQDEVSMTATPGGKPMFDPEEAAPPVGHSVGSRLQRNKALVLEAMTSLFQDHDASAVKRLYAQDYIQHNPTILQGRDALEALVADLPADVYYEPGMMIAQGDRVAIHGRIRGWAPSPQIVVDIFRVEAGKLVEHWDVLQDEVPASDSLSGVSMFDPEEGVRRA